jgi:peptidoglycan/xylan/chitin deacetylase (PgdA/CDA1 family)
MSPSTVSTRRALSSFAAAGLAALLAAPALSALPPARFSAGEGLPASLTYRQEPPVASGSDADLVPLGETPREPLTSDDLENRALVLCWHTFLGKPSVYTDFSLAEFGSQLDDIRALGYRFVSVEDFLDGRIRGRKNVIVTIDDGHRTVPAAIHKVLEPRGIPPTIFVYPAVLGTTAFAMSDTVLASLAAEGVDVGAHGYHHLQVTETLFKDDPKAFMDEIYKSKRKSEALSGKFVLAYAYPYGVLSPRTKSEVRKAGFSAAFAVKPGFVYARQALNDEFELPRIVVTRETWKDIAAFLARNASPDISHPAAH